LFFTKGSKTEKVEFRDLSFNEVNIDGQKTKVIKEDKLLGVIDIKTIKEKNYSLKPDDYFKEEVVIKEEDEDKWIKLGDIVKFNIGGTPSRKESKYYEGDNLWISVSELNNTIINDTKEKITDLGIKESSVKLIKKGSILMSFKLSIGKMGIAGKDMYCNEAIMFFKHDNDITNKYLYYYLSLNNLLKYASGQIGIGSLNKTSLYNITLPNLSIDHQEEIVEFLDEQFENYNINNLKKDVPIFKLLIAKQYEMAAELLYMVYRQMEADQEVKNIEKVMKAVFDFNMYNLKDCETIRLGDIIKFDIGGTPSRKESKYFNGNHLWVSVSELNNNIISDTNEKITDEGIKNSSVKLIKKGSVLMSFKLSIGKMGTAGKDMYCNEAIMFFKHNKEVTNKYLYRWLQYNNLYKYASGQIGSGSLNKTSLSNIQVQIPSLEKQQEIINKIEKFEKYKLEHIEHASMIKQELDNYIQNINDNEINENINYNNINYSNESEADLEIEIEESEIEDSE